MQIQEVYQRVLFKVNRNLGSNNTSLDRARFVLLYNENQWKRVIKVYREGNDERLREIQAFLTPHQALTLDTTTDNKVLYNLPEDYLELSHLLPLAKKGECQAELSAMEIKDKNYQNILFDNYNKPSFEYRETLYTIADNKAVIYKEDFDIISTKMSYYRYPKPVDIAGYIDLNSNSSTNIDPEGDDRFIENVINMVALAYSQNTENPNLININQNRINN